MKNNGVKQFYLGVPQLGNPVKNQSPTQQITKSPFLARLGYAFYLLDLRQVYLLGLEHLFPLLASQNYDTPSDQSCLVQLIINIYYASATCFSFWLSAIVA